MCDWTEDRSGLVILLAITTATYSALALAGFVWDDVPLVLHNEHTGSWTGLKVGVLSDFWTGAGHESGYYRPLMLLSLALDRFLWEGSGMGHHLHSLAWHLAAISALWFLLRSLAGGFGALAGATVFALHPLQSEAVSWIASRNDPMAAVFVFLGVWVLLPERVSGRRLALGGVCLLCGLLSKESAVFAILLLLGLDLARWGRLGQVKRYGAAAAALVIWGGLRSIAGVQVRDLPKPEGWVLMAEHWAELVGLIGRLLVWPWPLSPGRALEYLDEPLATVVLGFSVLVLGTAFLVRKGGRLAAVGLVFFVLALAPAVLALAGKGLFGERYLYLPISGLSLAIAVTAQKRWQTLAVLGVLASASIAVLHQRLPDWQSGLFLWQAALRDTPSGFVHAGVGHELNRRADFLGMAADQAEADGDMVSAAAHRTAQRAAGVNAGKHFISALRDEPPFYDVCTNAMRSPLRVGDQATALAHARVVSSLGCEPTPERVALLASLFAQNGMWDEAGTVAAHATEDDEGRLLLVQAALGLLDNDPSTLNSLYGNPDLDSRVIQQQLAALLAAGGRDDVVVPTKGILVEEAP